MPLPITVKDLELEAKLRLHEGSPYEIFIYFTATRDPSLSNERWCPDARAAEPVWEEALRTANVKASSTVFLVEIARDVWLDKTNLHRFREAPWFVSGIPTLAKYNAKSKQVERRLEECEQLEAMVDLLQGEQTY